ncbi:MAG TPA: hypothetical protein VJB99_03770 [Patescibacteria group bacterium]|nr:hypothetical protein [Patescibacteria group bacterium]
METKATYIGTDLLANLNDLRNGFCCGYGGLSAPKPPVPIFLDGEPPIPWKKGNRSARFLNGTGAVYALERRVAR